MISQNNFFECIYFGTIEARFSTHKSDKTNSVNDCQAVCEIISECGRWEFSKDGCQLKKRYGWTTRQQQNCTSGYKTGTLELDTQSDGGDLDCSSVY